MHSDLGDLGIWAASMSGTALLSDELAAQRLEMHDAALGGPLTYGLGIMAVGTQFGHEGEAIGWEGWAGHDLDTGETAVVFTNTCADSGALFSALAVLDPSTRSRARAHVSRGRIDAARDARGGETRAAVRAPMDDPGDARMGSSGPCSGRDRPSP